MSENGMVAVLFVCITTLFVLFAGTPDLMDALISHLQGCKP